MRSAVIFVALAAGCGTTYQSVRVVDPGKYQISGSINRTTPDDDLNPDPQGAYSGDIQVRRGIQPKLDAGVRYAQYGGVHLLAVDAKYELIPQHVSLAMPVGIMVGEDPAIGMRDLDYIGILVVPTILAGTELSPNQVELVVAPKLYIAFPDDADSTSDPGISLGFRLSKDLSRWAIHPEVGFVDSDPINLLTVGVGLSATY